MIQHFPVIVALVFQVGSLVSIVVGDFTVEADGHLTVRTVQLEGVMMNVTQDRLTLAYFTLILSCLYVGYAVDLMTACEFGPLVGLATSLTQIVTALQTSEQGWALVAAVVTTFFGVILGDHYILET